MSPTASLAEPAFLSGARLSGLLVRVPCERSRVEAALAGFGRLRLVRDPDCPPDVHPVHCELWSVSDGAVRFGALDQHQLASGLGAAWGGAAGALWSAALAPWTGSRRSPALAVRFAAASAQAVSRASASLLGTYSELMVSLPGVLIAGEADRAAPHTLVLGMVTDGTLARWADLALGFGYDKKRGLFEKSASGWSVSSASGRHLLSLTRRPDATGAAVDVRRIEAALQQPLLGRSSRGGLVRSWLRRTLTQPDARVAPVAVSMATSRHFLSALLPERGELSAYSDGNPWGGLEFVNLDAKVSYPSPA